jgi:hypothetical protein
MATMAEQQIINRIFYTLGDTEMSSPATDIISLNKKTVKIRLASFGKDYKFKSITLHRAKNNVRFE